MCTSLFSGGLEAVKVKLIYCSLQLLIHPAEVGLQLTHGRLLPAQFTSESPKLSLQARDDVQAAIAARSQ